MDESVINGANLYFPKQFGIDPGSGSNGMNRNQWLVGLVNSAPYVRSLYAHIPSIKLLTLPPAAVLRYPRLLAD